MITGFNTDIEYQGVTYHVQTEDKGVKTPLILSLVYNRGTILASKRSAYDDLLIGSLDEKQLSERLQKQHRLICAAVQAGRLEDLKRMMARDSASKQRVTATEAVETKSAVEQTSPNKKPEINEAEIQKQTTVPEAIQSFDRPKDNSATVDSIKTLSVENDEFETALKQIDELIWDVPISVVEEPIVEEVRIVEEEFILSGEAVEIITASSRKEQIAGGKLKIRLLNDEKLKSGERKTVVILVNREDSEKGLSGAQVMVKVIGSSFRSLIFHSKTDANGVATVQVQLPQFRSGRGALLVKVMSGGEEADLRRVIAHD